MLSELSNQTIVLNLLRNAVPERAGDISKLWKRYGPDIEVVPSANGVTMNAKCGTYPVRQ